MKDKYIDLIEQTFDFPQKEFRTENGNLLFKNINLIELVEQYGTPFRFTYLPQISENIEQCRTFFKNAFEKLNFQGNYHYCYCTKSSHFRHIVQECLNSGAHIETSSSFDIDIILELLHSNPDLKSSYILCNGYKTENYILKIKKLIEKGFSNVIPIIDNIQEFELLDEHINEKLEIGIRIATEEDPKFEFYTSRLGIGYNDILPFFNWKLKGNKKFKLSLLHFFVNTGIRDNAYYWNELRKFLSVYKNLMTNGAKIEHLDIGGGFPVKNSLGFNFDYQYMVNEIVEQIKISANSIETKHPNVFTEFGSFTVAESGGMIFSILDQKQQNDREKWNMIDNSFMTTLPDSWAINKRFIMLPINRWDTKYERVFLGGLTCDSDDYYNSEQHINAIYLPKFNREKPLYIGFFNCGAYQESISGFGGIKHCLIPAPKHILIEKDENGEISTTLFSEEQTSTMMLKTLGYA